jgi:hypothetical protein
MLRKRKIVMLKKIIMLLVFATACSAVAQKQAANWYFGDHAGVTFNSGVPVALTDGQSDQLEGCATISDEDGNLLFYTDGQVIHNANHTIMPNGFGLLGSQSSAQSAIIIPQPGNANIYYVFTTDSNGQPNGLNYSKIDMTLDGGLGDVVATEKNIRLFTPVTEQLTAVYHANNEDIWVIAHKDDTNVFIVYKVTSSGVTTAPVISTVGATASIREIGCMKASPNGKYIAMTDNFLFQKVELFDFDYNTGSLSNARQLNTYSGYGGYGIEFSPNSKVVYLGTTFGGRIYQYDISSGVEATMQASQTLIAADPVYSQLQLAIDGKIYAGHGDYLAVINNPNSLGAACNFVADAVYLEGKNSQLGLPPFIQNYFIQEIEASPLCATSPTTFTIRSGIDPVTASWTFGDGGTSTALEPNHTYTAPGTYMVSVNFTTAAGNDIIHLEKEITILPAPTATTPADLRTCDALPNDGRATFNLASQNAVILGTQNPNNYTVAYYASEDDAVNARNPLPAIYTNTTTPQPIYARVTGANGCYAITDFDLIVTPVPTANTPDNLAECETTPGGGTATFNLTAANSQITGNNTGLGVTYYKNLSHLQQGIAITAPTSYTNTTPYSETVHFKVTNTASPGCTATGTLGLTVNPLPVLSHTIGRWKGSL